MKEEERLHNSNPILYLSRSNLHLHDGDSVRGPGSSNAGKESGPTDKESEGSYAAIAPNGEKIQIPKELFVSLVDFMQTRKSPGSITIQFRSGEIISVEAVAKKTYRNS